MATSSLILQPVEPPKTQVCSFFPAVAEECIQIFLVTNKDLIPLRIFSSDTVTSVKLRIQSKQGFYVKQQRLVYGGRELWRANTLIKDYGVSSGDVLHLVLRVSDILGVTVKTQRGREYLLNVDEIDQKGKTDLKQLKSSTDENDLTNEEQRLILRGKRLDDQRVIDELALDDDAVVHIVASKGAQIRTHHTGKLGQDIELCLCVTAADRLPSTSSDKPQFQITSCQKEFQVPDTLIDILAEVQMGIEQGHAPILSSEGTGGAYYMQDRNGLKKVGVFKPTDEEPMADNNPRGLPLSITGEGLKRGTRAGEGAYREVAAFILDHPKSGRRSITGKNEPGFSGVPPTVFVRCSHSAFSLENEKLGSLQQFVEAISSCEDMGPARFPVDEVHKIAILDMRLANTDRNGSNVLVCKDEERLKLVPIDHGYCLPHKFEDCTFEWLHWPQSRLPFSEATMGYIDSLDGEEDVALLEKYGWVLDPDCCRVLCAATMLLKKGAAAGLSAYEIGSMMCRERLNKKSVIEMMLEEVEANCLPESSLNTYMETLSQLIHCHLSKII